MGALDRRTPPLIDTPFVAWRVAAALAAWLLVLHVAFGAALHDTRSWVAHLLAWFTDALLLGGLALLGDGIARAWPSLARAGDRALSSVVLLVGAVLAAYPQLLGAYLQFPVNVLAADGAAIGVTVREYLGWSQLWPVAAGALIGAGALLLPGSAADRRTRTAMSVIMAAAVVTLPWSPHPIAHSVALQIRGAAAVRARVVPSLQRPPLRSGPRAAAEPSGWALAGPLRLDHVFLFVLEGVTASRFEREFLPVPQGFAASQREHAAYYSRYYATNLDSYTSLIAMLTGVQVPYRAYSDAKWFEPVNEAPSLAGAFKAHGARTTFVGTYAYQPFVPVRGQWDEVMDRSRLPNLERWVSVGTSRMEAATEDRAALDTIVDQAASVPASLTVQEMVFGHSSEWQVRTGVAQLAYYDLYLQDLAQALRVRHLESRSLIIVVSDHGDRALSAVADNYRVPLLVVGPTVARGTRTDFLSHQDLPAILASELSGAPAPVARTSQVVVGATDRWVYGRIDDRGGSLFIDDGTGAVLQATGQMDATTLFDEFQALVNAFAARFGPAPP